MHIDLWTLLLQTINVLVLVWLLQRFLYAPVMAALAKRQQEATAVLSDAEAARTAAQAAEAEVASRRDALKGDGERIIAEARKAGEAAQQALLAQARTEAETRRAEAESALGREREAMQRQLQGQAADLACAIAEKLLARLPPAMPTTLLAQGLLDELATKSEDERRSFAEREMEVVTAAALSEAEQAAFHDRLAQILGAPLALSFRTDPALLAGIELPGPPSLVPNSWRADLEKIRSELIQENGRGGLHVA